MSHQNKPIVVLGTGRSGTSAIAGILHCLGVHMGNNFIAADATNPYGHFEDIDFVHTHKHLVASNSKPNEAIKICKELWHIKHLAAQTRGGRWGFKDPLATNLAHFYLRNGFDMDIIWAYRDFVEVEKSSFNAYRWTPDIAKQQLEGRLKIMEDLEKHRNIALKVNFNTLLQQPAQIVAEIIHTFNLQPTPDQIKAAIQHVRKPQAN